MKTRSCFRDSRNNKPVSINILSLIRHDTLTFLSGSPPDKAVDWQKIAAALPGRTNKDCRKRWFNVLNGDLRKGPWTAEEDRLLGQAVEAEGKV